MSSFYHCSDDNFDEPLIPEEFTLNVTVTPEEGGEVSPSSGTFDKDASVKLTATPSKNYDLYARNRNRFWNKRSLRSIRC